MTVGVDTRGNQLVVAAPDDLFQQVVALVRDLDQENSDSHEMTRVVTLEKANPEMVRRALASIVGQTQASNREQWGVLANGGTRRPIANLVDPVAARETAAVNHRTRCDNKSRCFAQCSRVPVTREVVVAVVAVAVARWLRRLRWLWRRRPGRLRRPVAAVGGGGGQTGGRGADGSSTLRVPCVDRPLRVPVDDAT